MNYFHLTKKRSTIVHCPSENFLTSVTFHNFFDVVQPNFVPWANSVLLDLKQYLALKSSDGNYNSLPNTIGIINLWVVVLFMPIITNTFWKIYDSALARENNKSTYLRKRHGMVITSDHLTKYSIILYWQTFKWEIFFFWPRHTELFEGVHVTTIIFNNLFIFCLFVTVFTIW